MNLKTSLFSLIILQSSLQASERVEPYLGTIKQTEAHMLFRPAAEESQLKLSILSPDKKLVATATATAQATNDYVAKFHLTKLSPATQYSYKIEDTKTGKTLVEGKEYTFKTAPASRKAKFTTAFIACVNKDTKPVWKEIDKLPIDALVLAGDTPYIDVSDLKVIRKKHRTFLQTPELAVIGRDTSVLGNWDDHDFGKNNGNGKSFEKHKSKTRQVFLEYRAHDQQGDGKGGGIYHKTDHGPIEIFHLDPRWYSMTAPSPVDPNQPTCFGVEQWQWILKSLKESKAPFKVLSMGAIWQDKRSHETDDMFTYWYERDALLDFIKKEKITGVVLHGGDIHCSRYLKHPMRVGYDLHDFIMSPGHNKVIKSLNIYHPSLEWSLVKGQQFLTMEADTTKNDPTLTVRYRRPNGEIKHTVNINLSDLQPKSADNKDEYLRAYWSFDKDFTNQSSLGNRIDASPVNGTDIITEGVKGGAAKLSKSKSQYINIPRSMLNDNSAQHSISLWVKPESLPSHGSQDRAFLYESTAEGKPSDKDSYHLSLGLRAGSNKDNINMQMYTRTIKPATKRLGAPTEHNHEPFDFEIPRVELANKWTHIVVTFDSKSFNLYINGKLAKTHTLPFEGPSCEFGGIILGGHRNGEGRNFDGLLDEVKIWQKCLDAATIESEFNKQK